MESYNQAKYAANGIETVFVQDNHSRSIRNTVRGLHYQLPPAGQVKLIRAARGAVWDVAVDVRVGSPTFGKWVGVELSEDNFRQLYIPIGFAHGFCALTDVAEVLYKTSHGYSAEHEQGILWNDPELGVQWPCEEALLSERDQQALSLRDYLARVPFRYEGEPVS